VERDTRLTLGFLISVAFGTIAAAFVTVRLIHATNANAKFWNRVYLAVCAFYIVSEVLGFLRRRRKPNYFDKEMDSRHSLAKGSRV